MKTHMTLPSLFTALSCVSLLALAGCDENESDPAEADVEALDQANSQLARDMVTNFIAKLPSKRSASPFDLALEDAVITAPDQHDPALLAKLDAVAGRLLGHN